MIMHSFDRERLLTEVLEDQSYEEFRTRTFELVRRELRRRRTAWRPWLTIAAALVFIAVFWTLSKPKETKHAGPSAVPELPSGPKISTVPYVLTQPLQVSDVIRSVHDKGVVVETGSVPCPALRIVHTRTTSPQLISDAQLLAYFAKQPAGFINRPGGREFVLLEQRN
jgi:hypothetical protein